MGGNENSGERSQDYGKSGDQGEIFVRQRPRQHDFGVFGHKASPVPCGGRSWHSGQVSGAESRGVTLRPAAKVALQGWVLILGQGSRHSLGNLTGCSRGKGKKLKDH